MLAVIAAVMAIAVSPAAFAAPAREPAPPPASCRVEPASTWPALIAPGTVPDLVPYQDYRAGLALTDDARGAGVTIADVEYEWLASHAELAPRALPAAVPTGLPASYQARDHGTAVLGLLGGTADGSGITGIAPDAVIRPVSPFLSGVYRPAAAIASAAADLVAGDVLLVELQAVVPGTGVMVPIEAYPEVRREIAKAVARGIVVVEPAANGARDLATVDLGTLGANPWVPGGAAEDDSGALLVAAGGSGTALSNVATVPDLQRTPESNYGERVDLQGVGAGVVTSGYSDLPGGTDDTAYTGCFDGTSSASATVAGAVALVQGAAIARDGAPLTPYEIRTLLVETGLPQSGAGDGGIGPRPQVAAAIAAIASVRGRTAAPAPTPTTPVVPAAPGPVPVVPATGAGSPAPVVTTPAPLVVAPGVVAAQPAARRTPLARLDRRRARLVVSLRGLAPGARVTVNGRARRVVRGAVVVTGVRPRTYLVRVTAPPRAGRTYRPARFAISVPVRGAPRVRTG